MKIHIQGLLKENPRNAMRMAGYAEYVSRKSGNVSYVHRLSGGEYPRLHAYVDQENNGLRINLHLDQKGACYIGHTAHSGEYEDSDMVAQEAARIQEVFEGLKQ